MNHYSREGQKEFFDSIINTPEPLLLREIEINGFVSNNFKGRRSAYFLDYLFDRGFHVFSGYNLMLKTENNSALMEIECPIISLQPSKQAADMINACIDAIDPLYGPIDPLRKDHKPFLAASSFEIENIIDDMDQILKLCCFTRKYRGMRLNTAPCGIRTKSQSGGAPCLNKKHKNHK